MKCDRIRGATGLLLAGITMLGLLGCKTSPGDERSDGRKVDDKHLTAEIRKELRNEPVFKFDHVEVITYAGQVQLSGFVDTDEQKRRAGEIAQQTPGVLRVDNVLAIKPTVNNPTGTAEGSNQPKIYSAAPEQIPAHPGDSAQSEPH